MHVSKSEISNLIMIEAHALSNLFVNSLRLEILSKANHLMIVKTLFSMIHDEHSIELR
jgi:hypothetical protein